jgi:hypothetical protein
MKLKTLKELGISEAEIQIYEKVRKTRNERNIKELIHNFYDLPIFYFIIFSSACVSTLFSIWFFITINNQLNLIKSISFDTSWLLIAYLFALNGLTIVIFLISLFCVGVYHLGSIRKKQIEEEIYKR